MRGIVEEQVKLEWLIYHMSVLVGGEIPHFDRHV